MERAVKAIDRWDSSGGAERRAMLRMDHPHVIKLYEVYQSGMCLQFVMELCRGGTLFDRVVHARHFTEGQAAIVLRQALQAVSYMHNCFIAHRDLKPENFLFVDDGPLEGNTLKLIDFGTACPCGPEDVLSTQVGSLSYVSPQVIEGRYNKQCDVWSVGVILHILLVGRAPFKGRSQDDTLKLIRRGRLDFQRERWAHVSDDAKVLIRDMLHVHPGRRLAADAALRQDWIENVAPDASKVGFDFAIVERLSRFRADNELRKAALEVAARSLGQPRLDELRAEFQKFDADNDGTVSLGELQAGLRTAGMDVNPKQVRSVMANLSSSGSGAIEYTEFLAASLDIHGDLTEPVLRTAFNVFDRDGNGKITATDLERALPARARRSISKLFQQVASNGNGEIHFDDFTTMMRTSVVQMHA
uniref:Calmodulin n=1 Tax=Zooxanthella nutricula TaxID=1333877 RepID=A0A7S2L1B2_9DINO